MREYKHAYCSDQSYSAYSSVGYRAIWLAITRTHVKVKSQNILGLQEQEIKSER